MDSCALFGYLFGCLFPSPRESTESGTDARQDSTATSPDSVELWSTITRVQSESIASTTTAQVQQASPSATSSLTSIESKDWAPENIGGRKYAPGRCIAVDAAAIQCMEVLHQMVYNLEGNKLFLAPLDKPRVIIDLCTGSGRWPIEFARKFPQSTVYATDVVPIQPELPTNCNVIMEDVNGHGWFCDQLSVDYFHIRDGQCVRNWPVTLDKMYRCLKPGGLCEVTIFLPKFDDAIQRNETWLPWFHMLSAQEPVLGEDMIQRAGFKIISNNSRALPVGHWDARSPDVGAALLYIIVDRIIAFNTRMGEAVYKIDMDEIQHDNTKLETTLMATSQGVSVQYIRFVCQK